MFGHGDVPAQSSMFGSGIPWREGGCGWGLDCAKEEGSPQDAHGVEEDSPGGGTGGSVWEDRADDGSWPMEGEVSGESRKFPGGGHRIKLRRGMEPIWGQSQSDPRRHADAVRFLGDVNGSGGPGPRLLATRPAGPFVAGSVAYYLCITRTHISSSLRFSTPADRYSSSPLLRSVSASSSASRRPQPCTPRATTSPTLSAPSTPALPDRCPAPTTTRPRLPPGSTPRPRHIAIYPRFPPVPPSSVFHLRCRPPPFLAATRPTPTSLPTTNTFIRNIRNTTLKTASGHKCLPIKVRARSGLADAPCPR